MENQDQHFTKPKTTSKYTCKNGKCQGNCIRKQALIFQKMKHEGLNKNQVGL
jgi:hypothetical protein